MSTPQKRVAIPAILHKFPQHAMLIAEIISSWNILEDGCTSMFVRFTDIDPDQASILLANMTSRNRLDIMQKMGDFYLKREKPLVMPEFNKICRTLGQRLAVRNMYAHGLYLVDEGDLVLVKRKYDFPDPKGNHIVHVQQLTNEIEHFVKLGIRLGKVHWRSVESHAADIATKIDSANAVSSKSSGINCGPSASKRT